MENKKLDFVKNKGDLKVGDYIILIFLGESFPGRIEEISNTSDEISIEICVETIKSEDNCLDYVRDNFSNLKIVPINLNETTVKGDKNKYFNIKE